MGDWPLGLSTGCFYQTSIFDCLEDIRTSGFGIIEICSFPKHLDYHDTNAVRRAAQRIKELWLEPYSLHAPFGQDIDITSLDPAKRHDALREILRAAETAAELGAKYFVIHPGPENGGLPDSERLHRMENAASVLNRVSGRCRELGMGLVLENMLPHLFSGHAKDLLWLLGALEAVDLGVCLDTGHARLSGDLSTVVHKLSGHLWMVHASDNHGKYDDHLPPGDGGIEWEGLFRQLSEVGFRGTVILEIAGHPDKRVVLEGAQRARRHLREIARRVRVD